MHRRLPIGLLGMLTLTVATARAQVYSVTNIGTLPGGVGAFPEAINASGTIVGRAFVGSGQIAFSYSNGVMTNLGTLGGADSVAHAINDSGTIVGGSYDAGNADYSAFVDSGTMTLLPVGYGDNGEAYGINNAGTIAGWAAVEGANFDAFRYANGTSTNLGNLGGAASQGLAINASGTVLGWSYVPGNVYMHAFICVVGSPMLDLGTLGGDGSYPGAINDAGVVVGYSYIAGDSAQHAFIYKSGVMTDIGTLGGTNSYAGVVDSTGTVVLGSADTNSGPHAFIYQNGQMTDLNSLINLPNDTLGNVEAISASGVILAYSYATEQGYILTPIPPTQVTHFSVSAPSTAAQGTAVNVTVTALNNLNNVVPAYAGTVHFTSSDGSAVLPADTTLTGGTGTFAVTFNTSGFQTVTATDSVSSSVTGVSGSVAVGDIATHFSVSAPSGAQAGQAISVTVTALDASDDVVTGYGGTVHFTSSDPGATLPANTPLANGTGVFSVTLNTAGTRTVTATDVAQNSITGVSGPITVTGIPPKILVQPSNQAVDSGDTATFSVGASGNADTYQWSFDNQTISGATSSSYSVSDAGSGNAGTYAVTVTNAGGSVTSNQVTLTVNPDEGEGGGSGGGPSVAPTIATQPGPQYLNPFNFPDAGANPAFRLISDANGTLYGVTEGNNGTVFKVSPDGSGYTILHTFSSVDANDANAEGASPSGALVLSADGSTVFGAALEGGTYGSGTIYAVRTNQTDTSGAGPNVTVLHAFGAVNVQGDNGDGENPIGSLALNGTKLYGAASSGGSAGLGTVFAVRTNLADIAGGAQNVAVLHQFAGGSGDGANPEAGLVLSGGLLYGSTENGGADDEGTIYSVAASGSDAVGAPNVVLLHSFAAMSGINNLDGADVQAELILGAGPTAGRLLGVADGGGANGTGTVFSVQASGADGINPNVTVLHTFGAVDGNGDNADGAYPSGALLLGTDNVTLYGEAAAGGSNATGTGFSVNASAADQIDTPNVVTLRSFSAVNSGFLNADGDNPAGGFAVAGSSLIGVAVEGGADGFGTLFRMNFDGSGEATLHTFASLAEGSGAGTALVRSGNTLYGASPYGGFGAGVVFKVQADGSGLTVLHTFSALTTSGVNSDGATPGALTLSGDGSTLYGFAAQGGPNASGTAFSILTGQTDVSGAGPNVSVLHAFSASSGTNADGVGPAGPPALSGGLIYGAAAQGGSSGFGTVFSVQTGLQDSGSPNVSVLHAFQGGAADGASPQAGVTLGGNSIYGTTAAGGASGLGTAFAVGAQAQDGVSPNVAVLHSFSGGNDGAKPAAPLVLNGSTLYGTAARAGLSGNGTVFSVQIGQSDGASPNVSVLHGFTNGIDGAQPANALVLSNGALYGETSQGGIYGLGVIFAVNPGGADAQGQPNVTNLHTFTGQIEDGGGGRSALIAGPNGLLYGTAAQGGLYGQGVIFSLDPAKSYLVTPGDGTQLTFSVVATDVLNDSYQWYLNNQAITGASGASLTVTDITAANAGSYVVSVTDGSGSTLSTAATISVPAAPAITTQPAGASIVVGGSASFTVTATGNGDSYAWSFNNNPLSDGNGVSGSHSATLTLTNVPGASAGNYTVTVTDVSGSVTSTPAALAVLAQGPSITAQPAGAFVVVGNSASLSVTATGPLLTFQWYKGTPGSGTPLNDGSGIAGSATANLTFSNAQTAMAGSYYVVVANPVGNATSQAAALAVYTPGQVITGPSNVSAVFGSGTATFTAVLAGTNNKFDWALGSYNFSPTLFSQVNNSANDTETTALTLTPSSLLTLLGPGGLAANAAQTVTLSSSLSGTTQVTASATLTFTEPSLSIASQTVGPGGTVVFSTGLIPKLFNLQWSIEGTPITYFDLDGYYPKADNVSGTISLGDASTLTLSSLQNLPAASTITVTATSYLGPVLTATATLNFASGGPVIGREPVNQSAAPGGTATFTVAASGGSPAYQWSFNGTALSNGNGISGATASSLTLSDVAAAEAGAYSVAVSNNSGTLNSTAATLTVSTAYNGQTGSTTASTGRGDPRNDSPAGSFALYVRSDGIADLLIYAPGSQTGYWASFTVASDGSFTAPSTQLGTGAAGPTIQGQIANGVITASAGALGTLSGSAVPVTNQNPVGFYQASATGTTSGTAYLISEPNGQAFVLLAVGSSVDAGTGSVQTDGSIAITSAASAQIAGTIASATGQISLTTTVTGGAAMTYGGVADVITPVQQLTNGSELGQVGTGAGNLEEGFVIAGTSPVQVLVRAAGPALSAFGVQGTLAQPVLTLYQNGIAVASNQGWGTAANAVDIAAAAASAGAFAFGSGSADCAILTTLQPGAYTAVVSGANGSTGIGLAEVYETTPASAGSSRLSNESARGLVGTGGQILTQGLVIQGNEPKTVLLRVVGPGLAQFGVPGTAAAVQLKLFQSTTMIAQNAGWNNAPTISAADSAAGAFPLPAGSADAALVITLNPGSYTIQALGVNGASGVALIEAYEVP